MSQRLQDFIWDEMAKERDLKVGNVTADDKSVTYRVTFDLVFDRRGICPARSASVAP